MTAPDTSRLPFIVVSSAIVKDLPTFRVESNVTDFFTVRVDCKPNEPVRSIILQVKELLNVAALSTYKVELRLVELATFNNDFKLVIPPTDNSLFNVTLLATSNVDINDVLLPTSNVDINDVLLPTSNLKLFREPNTRISLNMLSPLEYIPLVVLLEFTYILKGLFIDVPGGTFPIL